MPFNRAFREKQRELKEKNKNKRGGVSGENKGVRGGAIGGGGGYAQFPEQDIHCRGMTVHITGRLDKYGNWIRD